MTLFRNVVFIAALAGLVTGILMTALQAYATVPLILQAETYETAEETHAAPAVDVQTETAPALTANAHDEQAWTPQDGFERYAYTALANIITGMGFALILVAVSEFAGGIAGWRQGVFWGFAGFAVFTLAPGLGLPPGLPGVPAADVTARQIWWIGTVVASAAGLWMIVFRTSIAFVLVGVALFVVPHIIGAPQAESSDTAVPASLLRQFVVAVTITNLIFWVALGAIVGVVRNRFIAPTQGLRDSFA